MRTELLLLVHCGRRPVHWLQAENVAGSRTSQLLPKDGAEQSSVSESSKLSDYGRDSRAVTARQRSRPEVAGGLGSSEVAPVCFAMCHSSISRDQIGYHYNCSRKNFGDKGEVGSTEEVNEGSGGERTPLVFTFCRASNSAISFFKEVTSALSPATVRLVRIFFLKTGFVCLFPR
ncbi:malyl-CoA lyase [Striga asiatica]|uniref:Malyl-CoA lyase n=1 Tax=Striga asiatica TaxID=4170 RepID=A0A5A7QWF0_STRAF|nr:malyl-CoA lyase [Striga asiatica]